MKSVLVPFTAGVEEIELITVVDILRRAEIKVCMASLDGQPVIGRSDITITPDSSLSEAYQKSWDMVVLPGGLPNANLLRDNPLVKQLIQAQTENNKFVAAICAAPTALASFGLTAHKHITSYPTCKSDMLQLQPTSIYSEQSVVQDDLLITSRGVGTAIEFALHLVEVLTDKTTSDNVRQSIVA